MINIILWLILILIFQKNEKMQKDKNFFVLVNDENIGMGSQINNTTIVKY